MRTITRILIILIFVMAGVSRSFSADETEVNNKTYSSYKVIYERNIFSKDRLPPRELRRSDSKTQRTTRVLSIYVLRGIAADSQQKAAFIEEQISGESMNAKLGTELLGGRITDIKYSYIIFEKDGRARKVKIGSEFGKEELTVISERSDEKSEEAAIEESKTDDAPVGDESDILKKLMERRKSELGN